jgi:hypothetical protein
MQAGPHASEAGALRNGQPSQKRRRSRNPNKSQGIPLTTAHPTRPDVISNVSDYIEGLPFHLILDAVDYHPPSANFLQFYEKSAGIANYCKSIHFSIPFLCCSSNLTPSNQPPVLVDTSTQRNLFPNFSTSRLCQCNLCQILCR